MCYGQSVSHQIEVTNFEESWVRARIAAVENLPGWELEMMVDRSTEQIVWLQMMNVADDGTSTLTSRRWREIYPDQIRRDVLAHMRTLLARAQSESASDEPGDPAVYASIQSKIDQTPGLNDVIHRMVAEGRRVVAIAEDWSTDAEPRPAGRRSRFADADLAVEARDYVESLSLPNQAAHLATRWHMSLEQVRERNRLLRKRGLLTAAPGRGRAGGDLTEKARALLASMKEKK